MLLIRTEKPKLPPSTQTEFSVVVAGEITSKGRRLNPFFITSWRGLVFWYTLVINFNTRSPLEFSTFFFSFPQWLRANAGNIYLHPPSFKKKKCESTLPTGASNVLLIRNVAFDSLLNAACHPILLKLIIKFDNASDRGISSLATANSHCVKTRQGLF